jgi:hypothetical protein
VASTADAAKAPDAAIAGATPLVLANAVTLVAALAFDWPLGTLVWPYLAQSLIIGWFARKRMLEEPRITTEGLTSNGRPVPNSPEGRRSTANFFVLHYGLFHVGYVVFTVHQAGWPTAGDGVAIASLVVPFAFTHAHSFRANWPTEAARPINLGALLFVPYLRIVPMHLTILFGGAVIGSAQGFPVALFVVLKTASDVAMHYAEHRLLRR